MKRGIIRQASATLALMIASSTLAPGPSFARAQTPPITRSPQPPGREGIVAPPPASDTALPSRNDGRRWTIFDRYPAILDADGMVLVNSGYGYEPVAALCPRHRRRCGALGRRGGYRYDVFRGRWGGYGGRAYDVPEYASASSYPVPVYRVPVYATPSYPSGGWANYDPGYWTDREIWGVVETRRERREHIERHEFVVVNGGWTVPGQSEIRWTRSGGTDGRGAGVRR